MNKEHLKSYFYLFTFLFLISLILTSSFQIQEVFTGILVSIIITFFANKLYQDLSLPEISIKRLLFFIIYLFILLIEIIKANIDVAYRVLHPKIPIKPGIVIVKTALKTDLAKVALANSITLTPGTFTLDIKNNQLLIHWINVKDDSVEGATNLIAGKFEKHLKRIFE